MSYSYYKSSSSSGSAPRAGLPDDAEFQAAKMQAMMGAPLGGTGGSSSYSYKSSSTGSSLPPSSHHVSSLPPSAHHVDAEMRRMEREMANARNPVLDSGAVSSSYTTRSTSTAGALSPPSSIHIQQEPSSGSSVKKVVTTTTTKTNPQATRELERLERDFSRIGRTPDDYHDDFDKLKRDIVTGEAYRGDTSHQEPVTLKVREERVRGTPSLGSGGQHETKTTTTTTTYDSSAGSRRHPVSEEIFIPVRTYDNTFDDFHMNRWFDHRDKFGSFAPPELNAHKLDWENRLRGAKTDMFKFSPHGDFTNTAIESSKTVSKNPLGNPEFSIQFDMRDFKAEDISLTTKHGKLIISATHEEKIGKSTSRREFTRSVDLPADIQINMMRSVFSRDGILSITAPIKPPYYDPSPKSLPPPAFSSEPLLQTYNTPFTTHEQITNANTYRNQQPAFSSTGTSPVSTSTYDTQPSSPKSVSQYHSSSSDESHRPLDFTVPVSGYSPEEISVSIEGRKVKVYGKHVESRIGGRKTHNEFTKMFDLPSSIEPSAVRCYIKEGHTLHIIANIAEDIEGAVHFIAVKRKH